MTRHIADTTPHASGTSARLARFAEIERKTKPAAATLELQRAPRATQENGRTKAYARIERGKEA